jgi:putative heme-binding domain-containing protein
MPTPSLWASRLPVLTLVLTGGFLLFNLGLPDQGTAAPQKGAEPGVASMAVPPGFVVEQIAGPPLVEHPMMGCFDERGRLFLAESAGKNLNAKELAQDPPNLIRVLETADANGHFNKGAIFADKMTFPMGVLWHEGALYTACFPSLWRLTASTSRAVDRRQELVTKFGSTGNAADIHGPFLGPDGWLYWTDGRHGHEIVGPDGHVMKGLAARIFRCRPDGRDVEVVCGGGMDDPVEIAFTPEGEPLATVDILLGQPTRVDAIIHCVEGGLFPYYEPVLHEFKRTGDLLPAVSDLGWVAPSGLMRYRDTALGLEYENNLFSAQFNTHKIQRHVLTRVGATFKASNEDFLVSKDPDFHPTDVLEDADGSLLVIDTGGWFRQGCPTSQTAKPQAKGGIYRIRRADAPKAPDPRGLQLAWEQLPARELAVLLDDPRFAIRDRAIEQLAKRGPDAVPVLRDVLSHSPSMRARRNAVWTALRIDTPQARATIRAALADPDASVRNASVHGVGLVRDGEPLPRLLDMVVKDSSAAVRREAATALGRLGRPVAVAALLDGLRAGSDRFLDHALIYALITIGDREATLKGLGDANPAVRRGALIALDQMGSGNLTREQVVPLLDTDDAALRKTVWSLITARPDWAAEVAGLLRQWLARTELSESRQDMLRTALLAFAKNPTIQELIDEALRQEKTALSTRLLLVEVIGQAPSERLPSAWVRTLIRILEEGEESLVRAAAVAIRAHRAAEFNEPLQRLANDDKKPLDLRIAALTAVTPGVAPVKEPLLDVLLTHLHGDQPPLTRLAAAAALGNARLSDAELERLTKVVAAAGALEISPLLAAYERSKNPRVGEKLVAALGQSPGLPSLSPGLLRQLFQGYPPEVGLAAAPLLKRLEVDTEKQQARLAELEPILSEARAARGQRVFFGNRAACSTCHTVKNEGGHIGPDLSHIGAIRSGRDLLEAVVFPSSSIVRGYEPYTITTREGRVYTGIITRETAEAIHLVAADRTETRIPRSAVEAIERSRVSIMPQGLDAQLSRQDLADLLAFLQSLR